jgi:urease subunit alpha
MKIELADTGLVIDVETERGDEFRTGFGRTARDGIHLLAATAAGTCDIVVTNVTLVDPVLGIRDVSIGIRQGRVSAIGRAGNPNTLDGVEVVVGTGTTIIPGDGLIATPGAIDTHVHMLSPRVLEAELSSGVTTAIGQEIGPVWGARGSSSDPAPLVEGLLGGASRAAALPSFRAGWSESWPGRIVPLMVSSPGPAAGR